MKQTILEKNYDLLNPLRLLSKRLSVWEAAKGMWKNKRLDPVKWQRMIRKEWDRDLPPLKLKKN